MTFPGNVYNGTRNNLFEFESDRENRCYPNRIFLNNNGTNNGIGGDTAARRYIFMVKECKNVY